MEIYITLLILGFLSLSGSAAKLALGFFFFFLCPPHYRYFEEFRIFFFFPFFTIYVRVCRAAGQFTLLFTSFHTFSNTVTI
jgi:hypothetical protein